MSRVAWHARLAQLFRAELRKNFLMWLRYPLQPATGLLALGLLFAGLVYGADRLPQAGLFFQGDPRVLAVSFFCWVCAMGAIGHIANELEEDARIGLLEAVFTSRMRASEIVLVRSLASSLSCLALSFLVLCLLGWASGARLELGAGALFALVLLDLALSGLGLAMAGLSIVFKRVAALAPLVYLAAGIALASTVSLAPSDAHLRYPLVSAVEVFARAAFGTGLPWDAVALAIAWAAVTVFACAAFLELCAGHARRRASLAHY